MKDKLLHKNYPRRIICVMSKYHPDHGRLGWLHGFQNNGFAIVEMDGDKKVQTVGTHYFEFTDVDKKGDK